MWEKKHQFWSCVSGRELYVFDVNADNIKVKIDLFNSMNTLCSLMQKNASILHKQALLITDTLSSDFTNPGKVEARLL